MLKKLFFPIVASILLVSCMQDLSKKEPYVKAIGKHFVLQKDLYLYQFNDAGKHPYLSPWPCKLCIGYVTPKDTIFYDLPSSVEEKYIGAQNSHVTLKGILWKGSTFTIKRIVEQKSFDNAYYLYLISPDQGPFVGEEIEPSDIEEIVTNPPYVPTWSDPPIFDPKAALPLPSDGVWWK